MAASDKTTRVYADLADLEHQRGASQERDRFLILAADAALADGRADEAEKYRARLLEYNPHHLLRPYRSLADAMKSSDVYSYVADLRASYPPLEAEQLLASLTGRQEPEARSESEPLPPPPPADGLTDPDNLRLVGDDDSRPGQNLPAPAGAAAASTEEANQPAIYPLQREAEHAPVAPVPRPAPSRPLRLGDETVEPAEEDDEQTAGFGVWIADSLFVLLLLAGLALAIYTLARPFLPLPDSPLK